jgi:hypothetical protein
MRSKRGKIEMLFYTAIFLASLIAVLVPYLIYKAGFLSYKAVSRASEKLGSSEKRYAHAANASGHLNCGIGNKAVTRPLVSAGANNHVTAWNLAKTHPVIDKFDNSKKPVWPPREAISTSVGKASKVRRYEGGPKIQTLDMVSKPFRRKVDSKSSAAAANKKCSMQKGAPMKSGAKTASKPWGW